VPEAFVESRKIPRRERLVEVLLVAVRAEIVVVASVEVPESTVLPDTVSADDEARPSTV
jgi:hypothetical protein